MPVTIKHRKKQDDGSYVVVSKEYVTVHERITAMHAERNGDQVHVDTWIVNEDDQCITIGARVTTPAGTFTGHARSNKADRSIEGQSPLEVAETSAVGRALGFAGIGITEGIATADEVKAATRREPPPPMRIEKANEKQDTPEKAAMRNLRRVASEKGMDDQALKEFLSTDSVKALAEHMTEPKKECTMPHPHDLADVAAGYRQITTWLEAVK